MSKMSDVYENGVEVSINCLQCQMILWTLKYDDDEVALRISTIWLDFHCDKFPDHIVKRLVHYFA